MWILDHPDLNHGMEVIIMQFGLSKHKYAVLKNQWGMLFPTTFRRTDIHVFNRTSTIKIGEKLYNAVIEDQIFLPGQKGNIPFLL